MMRAKLFLVFLGVLLTAALPAATAARTSMPVIKGTEVGYFGGAVVTHQFDVFVYSNLGPSAGNRVTVCVKGKCEKARGHNARTAWYSAAFKTSGLRMGDPVKFTVVAATSAGHTQVTVTKSLLCMHNDGSTPQS